MSFWSDITGTRPQSEQDAELERQKALYQAALDRRTAAGTITPDQAAADQAYVDSLQLQSTDTAATVGALEGATELFYNPGQWWEDTKTGAHIAADAASTAADSASKKTGLYIADLIKKILKDVFLATWPLLIVGAIAAFFYFGGWKLLQSKLKL